MESTQPDQPSFRPSKRQKVVRQRADEQLNQEIVANNDSEALGDKSVREVRKQVSRSARRHGMNFDSVVSAVDSRRQGDAALTANRDRRGSDQAGRFVRPIGQAVAAEDKHMTAFVDARLAELRSKPTHPSRLNDDTSQDHSADDESKGQHDQQPETNVSTVGASLHLQSARTGTAMNGTSRASTKARKHREGPSAADLKRDKLVEEILHESSSSIYDTSRIDQSIPVNHDVDNDSAAAQAFKRNFLADLQERNYSRRQPAAPQSTVGGPKLGGSRADRERMKALEEGGRNKPASG